MELTMPDALGMIETREFAVMVEASDVMLKAAKVELIGFYVECYGELISVHVIPRRS